MAYYLSDDCYVNNQNEIVTGADLTDEDRKFLVDPVIHYDRYPQKDDDDDYDDDYDEDDIEDD